MKLFQEPLEQDRVELPLVLQTDGGKEFPLFQHFFHVLAVVFFRVKLVVVFVQRQIAVACDSDDRFPNYRILFKLLIRKLRNQFFHKDITNRAARQGNGFREGIRQ